MFRRHDVNSERENAMSAISAPSSTEAASRERFDPVAAFLIDQVTLASANSADQDLMQDLLFAYLQAEPIAEFCGR
jgi:hypothetical protein